jgi:Holliday junction resolvase-like predicted endonuclease
MDENAVVNATCKYLEQQGFVISQRLSTVERGVDIIAEEISTGCKILIEAKGGTSSMEGSARFGKPYTQTQVFDRVAKGVFTCLQLRAKNPDRTHCK